MFEKVKIGAITYTVKDVDVIVDDRNALGHVNYEQAELQVASDLCKVRREQVVVHELVHAMMFEAGYNEHDEDMINRLGNVMHQVMQDNKWGGVE